MEEKTKYRLQGAIVGATVMTGVAALAVVAVPSYFLGKGIDTAKDVLRSQVFDPIAEYIPRTAMKGDTTAIPGGVEYSVHIDYNDHLSGYQTGIKAVTENASNSENEKISGFTNKAKTMWKDSGLQDKAEEAYDTAQGASETLASCVVTYRDMLPLKTSLGDTFISRCGEKDMTNISLWEENGMPKIIDNLTGKTWVPPKDGSLKAKLFAYAAKGIK